MFGSTVLELGIGLVFVFLLVSLICSQIGDKISEWLKWRASDLENGMRDFLLNGDTKLLAALYANPLIQALAPTESSVSRFLQNTPLRGLVHPGKLPIYIPSRTFALALFDTIVPNAAGATKVDELRTALAGLPAEFPIKRELLALVTGADEKIDDSRQNIETWFDGTMGQVTAIYKKNMWKFALLIGMIVSMLLNVDSVAIGNNLWRDSALRSTVVATATQYAQNSPDGSKALAELGKLNIPIGWHVASNNSGGWMLVPKDWMLEPQNANLFLKIIGWIISALAGAQGAPFWFDLLKKLTQKS